MSSVAIPGGRDVRASLDHDEDADAVVVACPPHPRFGGSRSDQRLRAVSDALGERGVATLRFDYGPWDGGRGERCDAVNALRWAADRYDAVGLFGYSFGATVALRAAADADPPPAAVSLLAPDDAADALDAFAEPVQVVYGERDDAVDWEPVVTAARERGSAAEPLPTGHGFAGHADCVATLVADFLTNFL